MTVIYGVNSTLLQNPDRLDTILPQLDSQRCQRIARLPSPEKKAQCAAAGLLLTHLFGQDNAPPLLFHGSRGKPYLQNAPDKYFNLTHTENWVFCAVSDKEIGIDAEMAAPANQRVAARCFTQEERQWMQEDPDSRFTPLWTAKEAYIKFTGFGLVLPMSSFTVPLLQNGWDASTGCYWSFRQLNESHLFLTTCGAAVESAAPALHILDLSEL